MSGADGKDHETDEVEPHMTVDVREPPDNRHGDRIAKQIAINNPGRLPKLGDRKLEIVDDIRQDRDDDRLVKGPDEDPQSQKNKKRTGDAGQARFRRMDWIQVNPSPVVLCPVAH